MPKVLRFSVDILGAKMPQAEKTSRSNTMLLLNTINVLLVEDENLDSDLMNKYLGKLGCKVSAVKTGDDAIQKLQERSYNIVICDINLANSFDGFELLRQARETELNHEVPFILVTSSNVRPSMYDQLEAYDGIDICQKWDGVIEKIREFVLGYKSELEEAQANGRQESPSNPAINRIKKAVSWRPW